MHRKGWAASDESAHVPVEGGGEGNEDRRRIVHEDEQAVQRRGADRDQETRQHDPVLNADCEQWVMAVTLKHVAVRVSAKLQRPATTLRITLSVVHQVAGRGIMFKALKRVHMLAQTQLI